MDALHIGLLQALVYADIFDYPLTLPELHRYAVGVPTTVDDVARAVAPPSPLAAYVERHGPFVTLAGRGALVAVRQERTAHAQRLWPRALRYARLLASLPFVRMVAVTGALAVDNVEADDDLDFLIVTDPGRLWVCRALVIALVRWAARQGDVVCPNYFLSTAALALQERDFFTAHELAQMVPVAGLDVYTAMRRQNAWVARYLPNASGPPRNIAPVPVNGFWPRRLSERVLRSRIAEPLERWERARKIRKFTRQGAGVPEAYFSPHHCKGHFDQHGRHTLAAFQRRWREVAPDGIVRSHAIPPVLEAREVT